MSDYDYGDDEHHPGLGADSSDSEKEDNVGFVPAKRRFQYTTFGDEDKQDEEDTVDGKEAATYGVFMNNEQEDSSFRRRKRGRTAAMASLPSMTTPMFVKAATTTETVKKDEPTEKERTQANVQKDETSDTKDSSSLVPPKEPEKDDIDAEEEEQLRLEQQRREAANAKFLELLKRGKGKERRARSSVSSEIREKDKQEPEESMPQMGLGLGMPRGFGGGLGSSTDKPSVPIRVDPNIGKWEKHTKGIGMKLLTKMGYKGSGGLGSKRKVVEPTSGAVKETKKSGISRPVEVVVRPANLGLGFGNFKEASKLKGNRQIEADVRGVKLPEKKPVEQDEVLDFQKTSSSALPSTQELLQQQSWKRGARKQQSRKKGPKRTVVPYTELLQTQKQSAIIDMRGPAAAKASDETAMAKPPLAEELLHNVSILLNSYENKLHSASHFVESTKRKLQSLQSNVDDMERRKEQSQDRTQKLQKVLVVMDQIDEILLQEKVGKVRNDGIVTDENVGKVQALVQELGRGFSDQEKEELRFDQVVAPSLLSPMIQSRLAAWDPLKDESPAAVLTSVFGMGNSIESLKRTVLFNHVLPKVRKALESTRWNPVYQVEPAVQLVEAVLDAVKTEFPPNVPQKSTSMDGDHQVLPSDDARFEEQEEDLTETVKRELILDTVFPKLTRAMNQWDPILDNNTDNPQIEDRLDSWILPWIEHLDHPSILPMLVTDCRRKVRSALSYLKQSVPQSNDHGFFHACLQVLSPWVQIIQTETLQELASKYVAPRLARYLSRQKVDRNPKTQDWSGVDVAFQWHQSNLLSSQEFLSLIEGEVLATWVKCSFDWLSTMSSSPELKSFAIFYGAWKTKLFESETFSSVELCDDDMVCRMFYSGLFLAQKATSGTPEELSNYAPSTSSYPVVLARRATEERQRTEEELQRMDIGVPSSGTGFQRRRPPTNGMTFRNVVEEVALENNVSFLPKLQGNTTKDGKQIFLFGSVQIYIDSTVVFALKGTKWIPTSLEDLATLAA